MYILGEKSKSTEGLSNFSVRTKVEDMVGQAKEKNNQVSPLVRHQSGKAYDLIREVQRKGIVHNEKEYLRVRLAFEQNYQKLNPFK